MTGQTLVLPLQFCLLWCLPGTGQLASGPAASENVPDPTLAGKMVCSSNTWLSVFSIPRLDKVDKGLPEAVSVSSHAKGHLRAPLPRMAPHPIHWDHPPLMTLAIQFQRPVCHHPALWSGISGRTPIPSATQLQFCCTLCPGGRTVAMLQTCCLLLPML